MKHLKQFSLTNEGLSYDELIDFKHELKDSMFDIISFDKDSIDFTSEELTTIVENDIDLYFELIEALIHVYPNVEDDIRFLINSYFETTHRRDENPIMFNALKYIMLNKPDRVNENFALINSFNIMRKKYYEYYSVKSWFKYEDVKDVLDKDSILKWSDKNLIEIKDIDLLDLSRTFYLKDTDLIHNKNDIYNYLKYLYDKNPLNSIVDYKILTKLVTIDIDLVIETLNALSIISKHTAVYKPTENEIEHLAETIHTAMFSKVHTNLVQVKKRNYYEAGYMGPHIIKIINKMVKNQMFDEIFNITKYHIPYTVGELEKTFSKDQIKELLDQEYITLHEMDRKRILESHDQYSLYTESPLYSQLIKYFKAVDVTTPLIKKNGNLRLNVHQDSYSLHSYGEVRRVGVSGISLKAGIKADTPEGVDILFRKFGEFISRQSLLGAKNSSEFGDDVLTYIKKTKFKMRKTTYDEWLKWYDDLYQYISNETGVSKTDIGHYFLINHGCPHIH